MDDFRQVKVHFELEIEGDGYPPISVETLNGFSQKDGIVRLDNTPFFATGVALGDTVSCKKQRDAFGCQFDSVVQHGSNKAISVIFIEQNAADDVYQYLKTLGCYCEYGEFGPFNMLAVCVYKGQDYRQISSYLMEREGEGIISFAELCV